MRLGVIEAVLHADAHHAELRKVIGEGEHAGRSHATPSSAMDGDVAGSFVGGFEASRFKDVELELAVSDRFVDERAGGIEADAKGVDVVVGRLGRFGGGCSGGSRWSLGRGRSRGIRCDEDWGGQEGGGGREREEDVAVEKAVAGHGGEPNGKERPRVAGDDWGEGSEEGSG